VIMLLLAVLVLCAGKLSNIVREMVTSTALSAASGVKRKQLLVMDEVDGMSGGRGEEGGYLGGECEALAACDG